MAASIVEAPTRITAENFQKPAVVFCGMPAPDENAVQESQPTVRFSRIYCGPAVVTLDAIAEKRKLLLACKKEEREEISTELDKLQKIEKVQNLRSGYIKTLEAILAPALRERKLKEIIDEIRKRSGVIGKVCGLTYEEVIELIKSSQKPLI